MWSSHSLRIAVRTSALLGLLAGSDAVLGDAVAGAGSTPGIASIAASSVARGRGFIEVSSMGWDLPRHATPSLNRLSTPAEELPHASLPGCFARLRPMIQRILILCVGNICRSPMA